MNRFPVVATLTWTWLCLAGCIGAPAHSAERAGLPQKTLAMMQTAYASPGPGAAVMVIDDSELLTVESIGLADLEWSIAVASNTSFRLGSITKPFTAIAVLRLVESGSLALDQPISTYLSELPGVLGKPTIAQLLSHTSGLPDHFTLPSIPSIMRNPFTVDAIVALMADAELQFEPGSQHRYSNFNYVLLGKLIETMDSEGRDYGRYIEETIFQPLGMLDSHYDRQSAVIPRRARGYDHDGQSAINTSTAEVSLAYAAGGLMSSADDMAKFSRALMGEGLLSKAMKRLAWEPVKLSNGESSGYGLGFNVSEFLGEALVWHNGSINGFQAAWLYQPASERAVSVLCNGYYRPNTTTFARRLLAELAGQPIPEFSANELDPSQWEGLQGRYQLSDGRVLQLHLQDGIRYDFGDGDWDELAWAGGDTYYRPDSLTHIIIRRDDAGAIVGLQHTSSSLRKTSATRTEQPISGALVAIELDPAESALIDGEWLMDSGDVVKVALTENGLTVQIPNQAPLPLLRSVAWGYFSRQAPILVQFDSQAGTATMTLWGTEFPLRR